MRYTTKQKMLEAWQYCDDNDIKGLKLITHIGRCVDVNDECIVNFLIHTSYRVREAYKEKQKNG